MPPILKKTALFSAVLGLAAAVPFLLASTAHAQPKVVTQGLYETGSVIVTLPSKAAKNVTGRLSIKGPGDSGYRSGFPFTRIDRHSFSTSLFHLKPATTYDLKIELTGYEPIQSSLTTRPEFAMPALNCTVTLRDRGDIDGAISQFKSKAGQETVQICLEPGTYSAFTVENVIAKGDRPFIIRAVDLDSKPVIDGNLAAEAIVRVRESANVWFDGLVVQNILPGGSDGGLGYHLDTCRGIVIRNNVITGEGRWGILMNRCFQFPSGHGVENDIVLIERNAIAGLYNSIQFDNNDHAGWNDVGMGMVIRSNTVEGGFDNFRHCGDEDAALSLSEDVDHYYRLTGSGGSQTALNIDVYDNVIGEAGDDNVEVDGVCSNYKFFRNRIYGAAANSISVSPLAPGPNFFVGNVFDRVNPWQSMVKMNTTGDDVEGVSSRNVFFFNNTMVRKEDGPALNLWWGHPEHSLPIKNFQFINNIILSVDRSRLTDVKIGANHIENPVFDYNHWYTPMGKGGVYEWWDGASLVQFDKFSEFVKFTGRERNGAFGNPRLNTKLMPLKVSPLIDSGAVIPGVSDVYLGKGPDKGASDIFHAATTIPAPPRAVKPLPKQSVTGLPAQMGSNKRHEVTIDVEKPADAKRAILYLVAYDADVPDEGQIFINGKGPIELFGDQKSGSNDGRVARTRFETSAAWWRNGKNQLMLEHLSTNGFDIYGVEVEFLP